MTTKKPRQRYEFDAFLSYSTHDAEWTLGLKHALESNGLRVWLDRDQIRPGNSIIADLEAGLEKCKSFVLVVSPSAVTSEWVKEEYHRAVTLAKAKDRPLQVIPVVRGKTELPGFLSTRNWIEFLDEITYSANLERLIWGITGSKRRKSIPRADAPASPQQDELGNPYIFERPAMGTHFFGRQSEMRRLVNALQEKRSVVVYGLQRVGKTSLVKEALDRELKPSRRDIRDIRIDMYESCDNLTSYIDFFETIIDRLSDDLPPADYKRIHDEARIILRTGSGPKEIRTLIKNFLARFGQRFGRPLLCIDEFQDIGKAFQKAEQLTTAVHPLDSGFIKYLGSLVKDGYLQLLCCGRYQIQMMDRKFDWQLLKLMVPIELSVLDEVSTRRLIQEPVSGRYTYTPEAVDQIITLSGCYPYIVQYLCYELIESIRPTSRTEITLSDVDALVDIVQEPQVRLLYADFRELEAGMPWRLLVAIAHLAQEQRQVIPWEDINSTCEESFGEGLTHQECSHALRLLSNSQVIGEKQAADTIGYFIRPDLLRIWLRKKSYYHREMIAARQRNGKDARVALRREASPQLA